MSKKITYFIGAGASANTIPVVANFHMRMVELKSYLESCLPETPGIINKPFKIEDKFVSTLKKIIGEFQWLIDQAGNYFTIDTLARKFYLTEEKADLKRLKICLITFLTLEQYIFVESKVNGEYKFEKSQIDKRYDSFIATVALHNKDVGNSSMDPDRVRFILNNRIKILSWNYDIQFELSLRRFLNLNKKVHFIQSKFQIFPNKQSLWQDESILLDSNEFSMVKLNGNAIWDEYINQPLKNIPTIFDSYTAINDNKTLLQFYLEKYEDAFYGNSVSLSNGSTDYFNFAWEHDKGFREKYIGHGKNLETAILFAKETEILVVIGYSFPIFNREIDNTLFSNMEKLEKVYIQDINPDNIESTMINAFKVLQERKQIIKLKSKEVLNSNHTEISEYVEVPKVEILKEKSIGQFVIPYELNSE